ncbi:STAS domain-containing protein [Spirochaeta africana]|uniref:STAS domain-containing protein n=1 Tax=Spirochaeta africana (strain ATCC 700263 / DSM 8902 / Z-7692) TaxID=889378 RepID=H9UFG3_SPIAZ|nr:STAS domain-containing protein [Spirochaeta africana]AFG36256.1 hypothetical protein Spiaf_0147 [Spirochaeta africana DSM 8902]
MQVERTEGGDRTLVRITGSVGIQDIAELHRELIPALRSGAVCIDTSGVTAADFSLVQLLAAARRDAVRRGVPLDLEQHLGTAVREAAARSGLAHRIDGKAG